MQLKTVVSLLTLCSAYKTYITVEDTCDDDCRLVNRAFDFPEYVDSLMPHTDFAVNAVMTEPMSLDWRYNVWVTLGPYREPMAWNGTGVPCGFTEIGDNVAFKLDLHLPECDAPAGPVSIPGFFRVSFPPPPVGHPGPIHLFFEIKSTDGAKVFSLAVHLSHYPEVPAFVGNPSFLPEVPALPLHPQTSLIEARNCADDSALIKNVVLDFPAVSHGPIFHFKVSGSLEQEVVGLRYGLHATMRVLNVAPLNILIGNGSACGDTTTGDHLMFNLGLEFPDCPLNGNVVVPGYARFTLPLDVLGIITLRVEVTEEETGALGACAEVTLRFSPSQGQNLLV